MSSLRFSLSLCFLAGVLVLLTSAVAQDVTTWHNDVWRTGRQLAETTLTPALVGTNNAFGWLWKYSVQGAVYAQPLAVKTVASSHCRHSTPCNMVFIATEQDLLYAFDADDASNTAPLWVTDLAAKAGGTFVDCSYLVPPCHPGVIYPAIGVTGTPVIDRMANAIYVVSAVFLIGNSPSSAVQYYLHAIDIRDGTEEAHSPQLMNAQVPGADVTPDACATSAEQGTMLTFEPTYHLQRAGLLLLNVGSPSTDVVYVAFTPVFDDEKRNGWILGYTYNTTNGFVPVPQQFSTTPYGTGGGIWEAGAGLASDGSNIFVATGNGTFDVSGVPITRTDYGDSMIKLAVNSSNGTLTVSDYFTPIDVLDYPPPHGPGLCNKDEDFGSGGILLMPDSIMPTHPHLLISADKQSYLYVVDRDTPGQFNNGGPVQHPLLPASPPPNSVPGYWSSPAYWKYSNQGTDYLRLYYGVDETNPTIAPWPITMYSLDSTDPISTSNLVTTSTLFCGAPHAPTPSISANGASQTTGILWAIESSNTLAPNRCDGVITAAVLHAYDATTLVEKYNSSNLGSSVGKAVNFPTPTIFNSKVYMGTKSEVDVFGLCTASPSTCVPHSQ